jgi:uncharacterized protein YlzI (FlbEa/FlbD family)
MLLVRFKDSNGNDMAVNADSINVIMAEGANNATIHFSAQQFCVVQGSLAEVLKKIKAAVPGSRLD